MTDMTIDQLQAENESLKAKNAELLDEVKKAKASRAKEGLQEKISALEAEKAELQAELRGYTFEMPVNAIFEDITPAGRHFRRAFEEHFDIVQDEETGKFVIYDKDGYLLTKKVKNGDYGTKEVARELEHAELQDLIYERGLKDLDHFLPKPKGAGAPGSTGRAFTRNPEPTPEPKKQESAPSFGMK